MAPNASRLRERFDPIVLLRSPARGALSIASTLARLGVSKPPVNDRGHTLDPSTHALLRLSEILRLPTTDQLTPEEARAETRRQAALVRGPRIDIPVRDRAIDTETGPMSVRLYGRLTGVPSPALVYLHGGGFVIGDLESHDGVCRGLAYGAGCNVIAIDYRLAPEHRFPAAPDDAEAAFRWVHEHASDLGLDPTRIAIGGDSAGGNMAAVTCRRLRDNGGPTPFAQLLIYPATDMTRSRASQRTFADGFFLTDATITWFLERYLGSPAEAEDPDASPLFAADLSDLPPAIVTTAGFDPLRDEGEDYAQALRDAGVEVEHRSEDALIHGYVNMAGLIPAARRASSRIHGMLRRRFYRRA